MVDLPGSLIQPEPALTSAARNTLVLGVLGLHAALGWALLQIEAVRQAAAEGVPIFVDLVAPPRPAALPQQPPALPTPPLRPQLVPLSSWMPVEPTSDAVEALETAAAPAPTLAAQPVAEAPAVSPAPVPPPPMPAAPRAVPPTAVRYVVQPEPAYPTVSRRLGEAGEVRLRVEIGTDGRARQVSVHSSSGFARLDDSAIAAVRAARFAPYTENGVALVVWTIVPIAFELQS